jgi:hypothetical protein
MPKEGLGYLVFAAVVAAAIGADALLNGGSITIFLARKLFDLVDYVEFWR